MRKSLAVLIGVGLLAVVVSAAVIDNGNIKGCYTTAGFLGLHGLWLTDGACPAGTTAISWSQQGTQTQPPAPQTAGATGLDVIVVESHDFGVSAGGTGHATALCPSHHPYAVGGGAQAFVSSALNTSIPAFTFDAEGNISKPNGWTASTQDSDGLTVYAICSK